MDRGPKDHLTARHYAAKDMGGPIRGFNPTGRHIPLSVSLADSPAADQRALGKTANTRRPYHVWRSRDNRKGRHAIAVTPEDAARSALRPTSSLVETLKGMGKMLVRYPVWDISYDVAMIYTIGSVIWCINGFFVWYPLYRPSSEFPGEVASGGGITGCIGASVFEVGAALALLEAVNENRADCFGWALERAVEDKVVVATRREGECRHHHRTRRSLLGSSSAGNGNGQHSQARGKRAWAWWPSWYELRTHYFRDIGFLACLSQMIGATIFWIAGIVGVPSILARLSTRVENGVYWVPQVVGGSGFIVSSLLFMLETQSRWYLPAPKLLGWHIGFWNLVGGIGFCLCGALGFGAADPDVEYASTLATFIGSWAFLLGSLIQLFESLNKYPISVVKGD